MFRIDRSDRRCLAVMNAAALALGVLFALPANATGKISDAVVSRQTVDADYALVQHGRAAGDLQQDQAGTWEEGRFHSATVSPTVPCCPLCATISSSGSCQCAESEGHRRIRHCAQRGCDRSTAKRCRRSGLRRGPCAVSGFSTPTRSATPISISSTPAKVERCRWRTAQPASRRRGEGRDCRQRHRCDASLFQ